MDDAQPRDMDQDADYILCACSIDRLRTLVEQFESRYHVEIVQPPTVCLTLLRAEDSLEQQEFVLGEALTTECEIALDGQPGYGVVMGDQPQRCYCSAVIDALRNANPPELSRFLIAEGRALDERDRRDFNLVLRTQVNFKLMEQE